MPRNERNILRHELIGLDCEVVDSLNRSAIGIQGKIIDETQNIIVIGERKKSQIKGKANDEDNIKKRKMVAKQGSRFRILIGKKRIILEGSLLAVRPEDRIKKKFKKW